MGATPKSNPPETVWQAEFTCKDPLGLMKKAGGFLVFTVFMGGKIQDRAAWDQWGDRLHQPPAISVNSREGRCMTSPQEQSCFCTKTDGYRGIWWGQSTTGDEYVYKYSGGLGTYPVQNAPFAVYAPEVEKTFFVWGGATSEGYLEADSRGPRWDCGPGELLHMVSYYDHKTETVPHPTILLDKWTADPHDNPVISIDDEGYLWVFSPSHGHWTTPSYVHRSTKPFSIERFVTLHEDLFAYPQVWWTKKRGLSFFHTKYAADGDPSADRGIFYRHSPDGRTMGESVCLGCLERGHYQVTAERDGVVASTFDFHPAQGGLEARTNLYFMKSLDFGQTWTTACGRVLELPVQNIHHAALVRDFEAEGLLCYIKDMVLDQNGEPHIHFVTSKSWRPGPESGAKTWQIATFANGEWLFERILESDHNYDMGSLYLNADGSRTIIGTSAQGPQKFNTGGEVELWEQSSIGQPWRRVRILTKDSPFNHSHPRRPVNAHPDFSAFWVDGHARRPSPSRLYFSDSTGRVVKALPGYMQGAHEAPMEVSVYS